MAAKKIEVAEDEKVEPEAPKADIAGAVARGVEAFLSAHLRNSSFSRDTPAWNHFQAGIPVLIGCIVKEMEG